MIAVERADKDRNKRRRTWRRFWGLGEVRRHNYKNFIPDQKVVQRVDSFLHKKYDYSKYFNRLFILKILINYYLVSNRKNSMEYVLRIYFSRILSSSQKRADFHDTWPSTRALGSFESSAFQQLPASSFFSSMVQKKKTRQLIFPHYCRFSNLKLKRKTTPTFIFTIFHTARSCWTCGGSQYRKMQFGFRITMAKEIKNSF